MKLHCRTATNIPKIRKKLIFTEKGKRNQKKEPPNSTISKVVETTPTVALIRAMLLQKGGGGVRLQASYAALCVWQKLYGCGDSAFLLAQAYACRICSDNTEGMLQHHGVFMSTQCSH